MTYTQQGDRVTLEMEYQDFAELLLVIGFAAGHAHRDGNVPRFYKWLAFANDMNATNPNWTPYEIPPEYQERKPS